MKLLTCEMCGSNGLVKRDGLFVCEYCGCKYTVEETRNLMNGESVKIQGTVTIEGSVNIANPIKVVNDQFESKLAIAGYWTETFLNGGDVKYGDEEGVDAVFLYYDAACKLGAHEPRFWLKLARARRACVTYAVREKKYWLENGIEAEIRVYNKFMNMAIQHAGEEEKTRLIEEKKWGENQYRKELELVNGQSDKNKYIYYWEIFGGGILICAYHIWKIFFR